MSTDAARRVAAWLPQGRLLPEAVWQRRHRLIVRLAFLQSIALGLFAWAQGRGPVTPQLVILVVAAPLAVAAPPLLGRKPRAAAATLSLMAASIALVHLWNGVTEAHFAFFVMVGVVALYQDWTPFGISLAVVVLHHGVVGTLYPDSVFGMAEMHGGQHSPWFWAAVHGAFVLAASLAHLASWRLNEEQVLRDPLTGLANRTWLAEAGARLLARDGTVNVLFLDLDGFKDVNDSQGHAAGDRLLQAVAERLRAAVRPEDLVTRLGGDEFAVVVSGSADLARTLGERLLLALSAPVDVDGRSFTPHCSIGVASTAQGSGRSITALLRDADLAMYLAKAQGRHRVVVYADGMAEDARRRADLQSDLAQAVAGGQLELHYQPVVALDGGDVVGHEALVRWRHPVRGLVPPVDFVPLAEQNGDIVEIGRWVLREAVRQAAAWTTDGAALRMAVNLSPRQLLDDDVPALVAVALADSGLPAARLTLEVTESVLVQDFDRVVGELARLRAMGVRIAIDDFGTGFSSLSYLRRLPTDVVKIDRSFVMELTEVDSTLTLVSSIIELARSLGLDVVAEGVETEAQRLVLERLECGQAQGYLFARPLPAGELDPTGRPRPVPLPA